MKYLALIQKVFDEIDYHTYGAFSGDSLFFYVLDDMKKSMEATFDRLSESCNDIYRVSKAWSIAKHYVDNWILRVEFGMILWKLRRICRGLGIKQANDQDPRSKHIEALILLQKMLY